MPRTVGYPVALTRRPPKKWIEAVNNARMKLQVGQMYRQAKREQAWVQSEAQYEGDHWRNTELDDPTADKLVVNFSFSTVNTIVPFITASDPNFLVNPYSGNATPRNATIQAALLNNIWRSRRVSGIKHTRRATEDALVYGDGWLKVGFDIVERRVSEGEYAELAELWVQHTSPWDVWIDPTANSLEDARWICERLLIPKDELQSDPKYKNTHDENVSFSMGNAEYRIGGDEDVRFAEQTIDGSEFAVVYEFTDLVKKTLITFSDGELPLRVVEDIGEALWVQMGNYRIPNSPYHMGELEQLWSLQQELNRTRSQMSTHRRRNLQKFFAREGALEQDALDALRSGRLNDVAFVKGDQPLENLVQPIQVPNLSADVYNISDLVQRDIYEVSGVNEYLRGATPTIRRTATEATIIEGSSNVKTAFKLRMVEDSVREAGTLLLLIAKDVFPQTDYDELQLLLTGRQAEAVVRADFGEGIASMMDAGAPPEQIAALQGEFAAGPKFDATISPTPDVFEGEYEVEVEQSSTELRNPQMREQKYREMATQVVAMAPALMQFGVPINVKRIMELWFEAARVDDVDALFEAPMNPMMGMMGPQMGAPMPGEPGPAPGGQPTTPPAPPTDVIEPDNSGAMQPAY